MSKPNEGRNPYYQGHYIDHKKERRQDPPGQDSRIPRERQKDCVERGVEHVMEQSGIFSKDDNGQPTQHYRCKYCSHYEDVVGESIYDDEEKQKKWKYPEVD